MDMIASDDGLDMRERHIALMRDMTGDVRVFLDKTLQHAVDVTHSRVGFIFLYEDSTGTIELHSWSADVMAQCSIPDQSHLYSLESVGLWGEAVRRKEPVIINAYSLLGKGVHGYPEGHVPIRNFMSIPIFFKERIVAFVGVSNKETDYDGEDVLNLTLLMDTVWPVVERIRAEEVLRREQTLFQATFASLQEAIIVTDSEGRIIMMNAQAEVFSGRTVEESMGMRYAEVFEPLEVKTREKRPDPVVSILEEQETRLTSETLILPSLDGTERIVSATATAMVNKIGHPEGIVVSFKDITQEHSREKELEAFLEITPDFFCVINRRGLFRKVNRRLAELLGKSPSELEGEPFFTYVHPKDQPKTRKAIQRFLDETKLDGFTIRIQQKGAGYRQLEWQVSVQGKSDIFAFARDVTEAMEQEEQLRREALQDGLTGLYNRHYLETVLVDIMNRSDRYGEAVSIALLDLDHFKNVNDTWGHPVGDEVLKHVAKTLRGALRAADILIRLGGEEFLVLMPDTPIHGAMEAAEKLRNLMEITMHPKAGQVTASFGIAQRMQQETFDSWYQRMDIALYMAKKNGRNRLIQAEWTQGLSEGMVRLDWRREWNSGNQEIDQQHRELVRIGNRLLNWSLTRQGRVAATREVKKLLIHLEDHFHSEELLLEQLAYPERVEHGKIHQALLTRANQVIPSNLEDEKAVGAAIGFLVEDVIIGHLLVWDVRFFPLIKARQQEIEESSHLEQ